MNFLMGAIAIPMYDRIYHALANRHPDFMLIVFIEPQFFGRLENDRFTVSTLRSVESSEFCSFRCFSLSRSAIGSKGTGLGPAVEWPQ